MNTRALIAAASLAPMIWVAACTGDIGQNDDDDGGGPNITINDVSSGQNGVGPSGVGGSGTSGVGGASTTTSGVGGNTTTTTTSGPANTATTSGPSTTASTSTGGNMCGGAGPQTTTLDGEEQAFLGIINNYRAQNGLGPLAACVSLNRAAQGHSEDMRDNNYFSHTGLNMSTPWDRACDACFDLGCGPMTAMAENIAAGNSDAQATFTQWRNSPGHNQNMLGSSFNFIGIGRATGGGQYGVYWTNVFARDDEPSCY